MFVAKKDFFIIHEGQVSPTHSVQGGAHEKVRKNTPSIIDPGASPLGALSCQVRRLLL